MTDQVPGFNTLAVHAGAAPDAATGARSTPIYQTTSFVFDDVDHAASLFGLQAFGNIYTRIGNPTCAVLEERVAALEGGTAALAVASGHAAEFLCMHALMRPGDEFVAANKLYGGSINQFNHSYKNFGWNGRLGGGGRARRLRSRDHRSHQGHLHRIDRQSRRRDRRHRGDRQDRQEAPHPADRRQHDGLALPASGRSSTGPTSSCIRRPSSWVDTATRSRASSSTAAPSTGAGDARYPMLSQPRPEYGGMVLGETFGNFAFAIACRVLGLRDLGPALSPFNAFMILQGIETLPLRMQRQSDTTLKIARAPGRPREGLVGQLSRAGEPTSTMPSHQRYCPQGAGAVFTFGVKGGYEAGVSLVSNLKLFSHLANIGDTRSLVIHPASTTHRQLTEAQQMTAGAGPDVVRLSIGLEDLADLVHDLDQALSAG